MRFLFLFILLAIGFSIHAQTVNKQTDSTQQITAVGTSVKDLDTEESLKYMGDELLFQVRKRLHLTTEEEEKQESKPKDKVRFNLFGLRIERN